MKTIFTTLVLALCLSQSATAQQDSSRRAGERLNNELQVNAQKFKKRQTAPLNMEVGSMPQNSNNSGGRVNRPSNNSNRPSISGRPQQRPHYSNYGVAEVFLRIPQDYGYYTIILGDQIVANDVGFYRFYEVPSGNQEMLIYYNNTLIFASYINVSSAKRIYLDYYYQDGLYLLGSQHLYQYYNNYNNNYWGQMWDGYYDNNYGHQQPQYPQYQEPGYSGYPPQSQPPFVVDNEVGFNQFMQDLNSAPFASTKMEMVKTKAITTAFTSSQVGRILSSFSFDNDRLEAAKFLYKYCVDPQNYMQVMKAFSFDSSKNALMQYMQQEGGR